MHFLKSMVVHAVLLLGPLVALVPGAARAQDALPALHDVRGVAADDVLNVRSGPGADTPVVGTLAPDATAVEVIRTEGRWGLVNLDESSGWTSMKFLERRMDGGLAQVPRLGCFGTEPFWSLDITPGMQAILTTPDLPVGEPYQVGPLQRAYAPMEKYVLRGTSASGDVAVVVTPAYCDDGMSDREFGLDATVIVSGAQGPLLGPVYAGCCTLSD